MSKPTCKKESIWQFFRNDDPGRNYTQRKPGVARWMKKQMTRARRRFYKQTIESDETH
jgi:hypothetical protein